MKIWMDLEGRMINEINQTEKDKYHMILLIHGIKIQMNKIHWFVNMQF